MIKNIIFDLGNVLLNFEPLEYLYKKIPEKHPNESIFIDDTRENIEGATKLGFKTILFTTDYELREKLVGYNVL